MGTPSGFSQSGQMTGHCEAGAVKRALAWAASSLLAGVQSRPFQSMAWAGDSSVMPSHQTSPSSRQRAVREDDVLLQRVHGHGIGVVGRARRHAEEARLGIDGVQPAVAPDLHPGDVVADALALPALDRRLHHGQVRLAAGRGERRRDMVALALGVGQPQDQHMLRHPAFLPGHVRSDAERQALLAQQRVAAVARTVGPDEVLFGKVADVLLLDRRAGPGRVLLAFLERSADGMQAGDELALSRRARPAPSCRPGS